MKTKIALLGIAYLLNLGIVNSQQHPTGLEASHTNANDLVKKKKKHELAETFFQETTIRAVLKKCNLEKTYQNNPEVQTLVSEEYALLSKKIHELIENNRYQESDKTKIQQAFYLELLTKVSTLSTKPTSQQAPVKSWNGPCENMDFETCDLSGWTLTLGDVDGSTNFSFVNPTPGIPGPFFQVNNAGLDPLTGISRVNPDGGSCSVRLGNGGVNGAQAARMSQSFLVDSTNRFFQYSYAIIVQSPDGHGLNEQPYFSVQIYDELENSIPCGAYSVIADAANLADFSQVGTAFYKDWTTVFTNLTSMIGQNVTIEFTAGDCALGGHYGYAYVDASCAGAAITASTDWICPGEVSILTAPAGLSAYQWNTGQNTPVIVVGNGGTYQVDLIPFQGAACALNLDYTIYMYPEPQADFITNPLEGCVNTPVIFQNTSTIPDPGLIIGYQWNFGDGTQTPMSNGGIAGVPLTAGTYLDLTHQFANPGIYNITLIIQSSDGCLDSITYPLTIHPNPIVSGGPDLTICQGQNTTLIGAGATTYTWDQGVIDGIAFTPSTTNNYVVTGTNAFGCIATDSILVQVNPLPQLTLSGTTTTCFGDPISLNATGAASITWNPIIVNNTPFIPAQSGFYVATGTSLGCTAIDSIFVTVNPLPILLAGNDTTVCLGESIQLNAQGASNYTWNPNVNNGIPFIPMNSATYTLTGTLLGCSATDSLVVTVNPLPNISAGPDQIICLGSGVTLSGSGGISYQWNNGVINNQVFNPTNTSVYTVTGTDINGCQQNDQVLVTVNPIPNIQAGMDLNLCQGNQITLQASGGSAYNWNNGAMNGAVITPPLGNTTYTVTGTSAFGCSATDSFNVQVNPLPNVDFDINKQSGCEGDLLTLENLSTNSIQCIWHIGNSILLNSCNPLQTISLSDEGVYDVSLTVTDMNGCTNTLLKPGFITIYPYVNADFYASKYELTSLNTQVVFTNTSVNAFGYQWQFNDGTNTTNQTHPTHVFPDGTTEDYLVQLIAFSPFGCNDTVYKTIRVKEEVIYFVPNTFTPNGDQSNDEFLPIFSSGIDPSDFTLYIFDRWGELVFESHDPERGWNGRYKYSGQYCQDGTYNWKIIYKKAYNQEKDVCVGHVNILR